MKFCNECNNKLYIKINSEDDSIQYHCKNCNYESNKEAIENDCCVYTKTYSFKDILCNYNINEYTCYDPTLPRVNNIACPNNECITNSADFDTENREVVYIKYDKVNMHYIYICTHCKQTWKNIS